MFTYSRSFISQAGLRYRFGPAHWVKEHLSEKTGSMSMLACPTWIIAVECPIQVYLIQLSKLCLNEGFCLGQGISYYSLMKSSFVDGSLTVSPPCVTLYLRNVKAAESPPVTIEFLILSNRKSNTPLTLSAFFRYLYSFFICYYSEYSQQYSPSSCWRFKLYQKSNINIWQTLFSSLFHYIQSIK